jgi:uncharacterized C2H2 Zn-finger protein
MIKCPICNDKFNEVEDLYGHLEKEHEESLPKDQSAAQYYYFLKTGKEHGNCVVCKMPTKWNESTNKYARFCEMASCKEKYKEEFKNRMIGKYGRVHLLNDPDQQRKMLANRSISGKYEWSDNREVPYTGTYELDFLQFLDVFMHFDSEDIMAPSPHTYYYIYEGEEKFYIPDVFIASLNLEIEIKDGGDNPNTHHKIQAVDKVKEKLKDNVMKSQKEFSYIKVVNKNYDSFFDFMMQKKKEFSETGKTDEPIFILHESYQPEAVTESIGDISLEEIANMRKYGKYNPTDDDKKNARQFSRSELRMNHYRQIANPKATKEELQYLLEVMDAEYKSMMDNTTGLSVPLANEITSLKKEILTRLVTESFQ